MKKKLLSVLLAVCMVFTLAPFAMAEEVFDTWDGGRNEALQPDASGVYQLNSAEDLAQFAYLVNDGNTSINASLNTGINLDGRAFTPIGAYGYKLSTTVYGNTYKGTFNGNGHTICNGSINGAGNIYNMGLFGFVEDGSISNLQVVNITVNNTKTDNEASSGVVIGSLYHGSATNITVGENCAVTGIHRVGGVVGSVRDSGTLTNCDSQATVTGTGMYCGGIVGAAHDLDYSLFQGLTGAPASISYCDNSGTVNGNTEVGGIVGYTDQSTIEHCTNSGTISATGNYGSGGIVGFDAYNPRSLGSWVVYAPNTGATIESCTNTGAINGPRSGGIVGTLGVTPGEEQPDNPTVLTKISNCHNEGDITGTTGKCGAIFGYQITYAHGDGDDYVKNLTVQIRSCDFNCTINNVAATDATPSEYISQ